jgi:hypothetical protein
MGRAYSANGRDENLYRILVGEPEGKTPLGRPRLRWEHNIKISLKDILCGGYGLDLSVSGYGTVVGTC